MSVLVCGRFLSCLVLLAACMEAACATGQVGRITGAVSSAHGQALVGATVTLTNAEDGRNRKVGSTAASGDYSLAGIGYGLYRLSAAMAGYQDSPSQLIDIAQPTIAVDFQLQPSPLADRSDGFVEGDGGGGDRPEFRASGVVGATAPSGYSAGASADEAAVVTARGGAADGDDRLLLPAATIPDCSCNPIAGHACPRNLRRLRSGPLQADATRRVLHVGTAQLAETLSFAVSCHEAR